MGDIACRGVELPGKVFLAPASSEGFWRAQMAGMRIAGGGLRTGPIVGRFDKVFIVVGCRACHSRGEG